MSARAVLPIGKVFIVGIGNALEFYDFLTFSFFAIQIGHTFFPVEHGLMFSLATFGVGFTTRPLGGLLIGLYGDRVGRKPAMMLSFGLMGVAITGLALTPSYAIIGVAAPILLVTFRLVQGFALGGEVGPSTAFLIEAAPVHRRGLYVSIQYMTQNLATLAAGCIGFSLSSLLDPAALDAWGWRLAFLLGAAVVPLGLVLRRSLPETLHMAEPTAPKPAKVTPRLLLLGLMLLTGSTIGAFVLGYMTTYAQDSLHMATNLAFGATIVRGLCGVVTEPLSGLLSDRIGRKPVMITAVTLLIALIVPAYLAMIRLPLAPVVYGATAVLGTLQGFCAGPAVIAITESLPKLARARVLATLYAVAIAIFGGSTQPIIKWLTDTTESPLAPAWYMTAAAIIGGIAMVMIHETAPIKSPALAGTR